MNTGYLSIRTAFGKEIYKGEIVNDLPHGEGQLYYPSGSVHYLGSFFQGKFHGDGKLWSLAKSGSWLQYDGKFSHGEKHGKGSFYLCDRVYDNEQNLFFYTGNEFRCSWRGFFEKGYPQGQGKQYDSKGKLVYDGNVDMGLYHGKGKLYENGQLVYDGRWKNHKKHGQGIEYLDGNQTFKGKWKNDQKDLTDEIYQSKIASFFETFDPEKIKKVPLPYLRKYLKNVYQQEDKKWKRQQVIEKLRDANRNARESTENCLNEDLFGNEITIPCFGDDGGIYDLSSMQYMFERNDEGEYINIPYMYNENTERVPNYRRVHAAQPLTQYSCPVIDEWNIN